MKYENAKDILPAELLKALQQFASGKLLYVPVDEDKRPWGEGSGYREQLRKRNQMIRNKYANGTMISELADMYFLSLDSVKKIIYSRKKEAHVLYAPSLQSAVAYADNGMVEEWVLSSLLFTHDQPNLYEQLMAEPQIYFGVAKLPLRLIQTSQLPARTATTTCLSVNDYDNDYDYDNSPLIVSYEDGAFTMLIDESRILNLKQRKINAYPAIILMKRSEDHKRFMVNYGRHLIFESQGN